MGWGRQTRNPARGYGCDSQSCTQWLVTRAVYADALVSGGGLAPTEAQALPPSVFPEPRQCRRNRGLPHVSLPDRASDGAAGSG